MQDFLNDENLEAQASESVINDGGPQNNDIPQSDIPQNGTEPKPQEDSIAEEIKPQPPMYNPIYYSPITPEKEIKPMSKGLKVFALIMAVVILMTGACATGYFMGQNKSLFTSGLETPDLESAPKDTDEMTAASVYEKVNPSIVGIVIYNKEGKMSQASGIVYSDKGYIITNDHIYSEISSPLFKVYTYDGKELPAKYVAGDQISDLAVLKVENASLTPAVFGNSNEIYHGQNVVAIGRPSDAITASGVTSGIVSFVSRRVQSTSNYSARLIETTSAINPGSSGGALLNMYGQVIGVTSSKLVSDVYDNVGYAIPTTTVKRIADELIEKGKVVSRAKLGITYNEINSVSAEIYGYAYVGIRVASVSEDSNLYGKLSEGDFITHINGVQITADDIVLDIIEQSSAGDKITVTIVNTDGQTRTVEAVLKANVSVSSYTTGEIEQDSDDGTFNFPFGE